MPSSIPASAPGGGGGTTPSANASARASPAVGAPTNQPNINTTTTTSSTSKTKNAATSINSSHTVHPQTALSSMISLPLDLSSVERRGQPTAVKEPLKKTSRIYDLEEAPVYQPTEEEWKDPIEYMRKITPEAEKYGICKVIPPDSWNPDFAIDTERFHFRTRKQDLNSVEGSSRANITYVDALLKFHKQNGNQLTRMPYVDKRPLDLYRLKKAVESRGGFEKVCRAKKWAEIGRDLGYSGKIMSSLSTSLKNSYQKWLCPYEDFLRLAKPGVHQQLEWENGGPLTPSPAPSPMKRSNINTPSDLRSDSPARNASGALQASVNSERDTPMRDAPPPPSSQPATSGFTAINTGGFTAVNSSFTSVNRLTSTTPAAAPEPKVSTPTKQFATPLASAKNTPEYRPSSLGPVTALKRQMSNDSLDSARENGAEKDDDGGSRRSKRLKKEAVPTVAGSHMSMFRPMPRLARDESTNSPPGEKCTQCGKAEEAGFLAICESCDNAYHGNCLDPPLKAKPDADWNCPRCLVGDGQFGFEEGGLYSLRQFQEKAADFKQNYFEKRMPFDRALGCNKPVTEDDVEREFWRLVTDVDEEVQVEYGADIHCTTHGSGFPTIERHPSNRYSTDPWNLNVLPYHQDSLFRHIKSDISGMTVPWVYVGMTFSTFCWHNEDHYAYSANYQHFGATKTWYGIPAEDTEKFEQAMKDAVPELFETNPDLLFQLVTLLTPDQLKKAGVRVYAADQRAGQFVITFPKAYHAGFNHGFNFNEAVNFAPCDWEPFGLDGVERLQTYRRQPCFSHDELLWTAAEGVTSNGLTIQTAKWLAPALERIHRREAAERAAFREQHASSSPHQCTLGEDGEGKCPLSFKIDDVDVPEDEYSCAFCKAFAYLSRFRCLKSNKTYCLLHAGSQPCCDLAEAQRYLGTDHELIYRKTDDDMVATGKKVLEKASVPELWEEKYDKVLEEEPTPSLKTLRNLLNEGERIPYELTTLPLLRHFVDRCNRWVEEATNYTIRKQQNRRKNERAWQTGLRKSSSAQQDEREREMRKLSNIYRLMNEAEQIGFECPEIQLLKDRAAAIQTFQESARNVIDHPSLHHVESVEELLEEGNGFNVDLDEMDKLSKVLDKLKWNQKAKESRGVIMSFADVSELIDEAKRIGIETYNDHLAHYVEQLTQAFAWEKKAKEIMEGDIIHYQQLEALSNQAVQHFLPVSTTTLEQVDQILHKHREALRLISDLNARSRTDDFQKRPKYAEVSEVMKMLEDLQSKPAGTLDLEKEQRRHEDWMRKGKKLFGKTNAPLHILKSHMEAVLERNIDCFDITKDKPRLPAEPASREPSPDKEKAGGGVYRWDDPKFREVFCICRRVEAGMMIECELCHEWYHGKCLKIARGKVKEEDKYTCPICDWRVKIPRDAARPKLEDLIEWYDEIPGLPFQPEEEDLLKKIIKNAQDFRNHVAAYCNPVLSTRNEAETQRFYLRKIEGAEILLADETNFFRQELHKWSPVAPEPPPIIEVSKSTRKPRPTKLDRLLFQHGVTDVDDLPEAVKSKGISLKRKRQNAEMAAQAAHHAAAGSSSGPATSPGVHGYASYYQRGSSSQPQTPGLSGTGGSHAHPSRAHEAAGSSAHHGHPYSRAGSSSSIIRQTDPLDLESSSNANIHPGFFLASTTGGAQLVGDSGVSQSMEERFLRGPAADDSSALGSFMMSKSHEGRKEADTLFGPSHFPVGGPTIPGPGAQDDGVDDGEVDQLFAAMVNQDDEDEKDKEKEKEKDKDKDKDKEKEKEKEKEEKEKGKGVATSGNQQPGDEKITADSLEKERNGMDALLDRE